MAQPSRRRLRVTVFGGMAVCMLAGVLVAFWPLISADRRMQAFCSAQVVGMSPAQVQAQAQTLGYVLAPAPAGSLLVDDPAGFGRRQCLLALDAQGRVAGR